MLAVLLATVAARAGWGPSDKVGSVESVEIAGTVEVPLYASADGDPVPVITARVNGEEEPFSPFAIGLHTSFICVSDDFVAKRGLKVHTADRKLVNLEGEEAKWRVGGEIKWVRIDSLEFGGLKLNGVRAVVDSSEASLGSDLHPGIGIGAIPDVAVAILPSEGVVRFAPAAQGAALVDSLGGSKFPFRTAAWDVVRFGKERVVHSFRTMLVDVTVGGLPVVAALETDGIGSALTSHGEVRGTASRRAGDREEVWADIRIGDIVLGSTWLERRSDFERGGSDHRAFVGADVMANFDLAVDPASHMVALRPATDQKRQDGLPLALDWAMTVAEQRTKKDEEAKAEAAKKGDPAPEPDPAAWGKVAELQAKLGRLDDALASRQKAVDIESRDCASWHELGKAQFAAMKAEAAVDSLRKAAELYHAWWDEPDPKVRAKESKRIDKQEKNQKKSALALAQASSCHEAEGDLATALVALGRYDDVDKLYAERLDLDPTLAVAAASAAVARKDYARANGPLRQALLRESEPAAPARVGLGLAYAEGGDAATATGHFQRALQVDPEDAHAALLWLDTVRAARGSDTALAAAKEWASARPDSPAAHYAWARAAEESGAAGALEEAATRGDSLFAKELALRPRDAALHAIHARFLLTTGRVEAAAAASARAVELDPAGPDGWLAQSEVHAAQGAADVAGTDRSRAAKLGAAHPGYARLLAAP